jgi:hypothetical protein
VPKPTPPTLKAVPYLTEESTGRLFSAEGALLVASGDRVGRLVEGKVEWLGQVPPSAAWVGGGPSYVTWAGGRYPDRVDVMYSSNNGRAPMPTYKPLTGEGGGLTLAPGGGFGSVVGFATVGESTLMMNHTFEGYQVVRVRGPVLARIPTKPDAGGCKEGEVRNDEYTKGYAIEPHAFGASADGTVVLAGMRCGRKGAAAAEVWDKDGKSKIHDLSTWVKEIDYDTRLLHGPGEVSWIVTSGNTPIVEYRDGRFAPLPALPNLTTAFVSSARVLHVLDGQSIYAWTGGAFQKVADVVWPDRSMDIHELGGRFFTSVGMKIHRFEPAEPIVFTETCKTPFVYLYDVSPKSEPNFSFPATRKALSTFERLGDLSLVEFVEGVRRLGLTVPDAKTGEAVIAHVRANMKDENPKLLCYTPKSPRVIEMKGR